MVGRLFVVPGIVVFAGFCVVLSGICGVLCCLLVVLSCFLGHGVFPLLVWLTVGRPYSLGKQRNRVSAKRSFVTSLADRLADFLFQIPGKFAGCAVAQAALLPFEIGRRPPTEALKPAGRLSR
jgi:hypothetical protein